MRYIRREPLTTNTKDFTNKKLRIRKISRIRNYEYERLYDDALHQTRTSDYEYERLHEWLTTNTKDYTTMRDIRREPLTTNTKDYTNLWLWIKTLRVTRITKSATKTLRVTRITKCATKTLRVTRITKCATKTLRVTRIRNYEYERLYLSSEVGRESLTTEERFALS